MAPDKKHLSELAARYKVKIRDSDSLERLVGQAIAMEENGENMCPYA